eukprot:gene8668-biopygen4394
MLLRHSDQLYPVLMLGGGRTHQNVTLPDWLTKLTKSGKILILHRNLTFVDQDVINKYPILNHPAFLRLDIPTIVPELAKTLPRSLKSKIDFDYALYTDCDVLFYPSFNLNELPKPKVISLGGEMTKDEMANSDQDVINKYPILNHPAFLRLDIPTIVPELAKTLPRSLKSKIDFDYALYTDCDVLFYPSFNLNELPKPKVISLGGEMTKDEMANSAPPARSNDLMINDDLLGRRKHVLMAPLRECPGRGELYRLFRTRLYSHLKSLHLEKALISNNMTSVEFDEGMENSLFCLILPGDTPSTAKVYKAIFRVECVGKKTLWFMATQTTHATYLAYIKAALNSVLLRHSHQLYPVLILSGSHQNVTLPDWLTKLAESGKILIVHRNLTFVDQEVIQKYPILNHPAFLRLDIPTIVPELAKTLPRSLKSKIDFDYALYTDCDVLFYPSFNLNELPKPKVISLGGEMTKDEMANSGVLYMNIKAMRKHMADFIKHGKTANYEFGAYDQGYILSYFRHKLHVAELLPATFNWKPYWGNSNKTAILHFHGPKPGLLAECFAFMDNDGCDSPNFMLTPNGRDVFIPYLTKPPARFNDLMSNDDLLGRRKYVLMAPLRECPGLGEVRRLFRTRLYSHLKSLHLEKALISNNMTSVEFDEGMENSLFCLILPGDTPGTAKVYKAIFRGCIPVIFLYPVLMLGGIHQNTALPDWLTKLAESDKILILHHKLTFVDREVIHKYPILNHPAFLRLDIPTIVPELAKTLPRSLRSTINFDYALYTDCDVLFYPSFNLNELPKPKVISLGGEMTKDEMANSGVLYINISAMNEHMSKYVEMYDWS